MSQPTASDRIAALERFIATEPGSSLQTDAVAMLVWNSRQSGNRDLAAKWAKELLKADSSSPLGLAVLIESSRYAATRDQQKTPDEQLRIAAAGLANVERLRAPAGMTHSDFVHLKSQVQGVLSGAIGYAYVQQNEYAAAGPYLRSAIQHVPKDPLYPYALALARLDGKPPNPAEGYWLLARAVNLSRGTPAGRSLAEYASRRYQELGGSLTDWNRFLLASGGTAAEVGSPQPGGGTRVSSSPMPAASISVKTASRPATNPQPSVASVPRLPPLPQEPAPALVVRPRPLRRPGEPVSLGILIETSITDAENRSGMVHSLTDMVRRLRQDDEAFILSFSSKLVFEQDLTSNADLLRKAMDSIEPNPGAALFDAVAFAAGHLNRIARNGNRVLLVISDGHEADSQTSIYELSGQINLSGVRIYCIGVGVNTNEAKRRLDSLASRSGGAASYINDLHQFRGAAQQFASVLGMDFPL